MTRFVRGEVAVILRFGARLWGLNKIEPFFCHHQITLLQSDAVDASHQCGKLLAKWNDVKLAVNYFLH